MAPELSPGTNRLGELSELTDKCGAAVTALADPDKSSAIAMIAVAESNSRLASLFACIEVVLLVVVVVDI